MLQLLYEPTSKADLLAGLKRMNVSKSVAYVLLNDLEQIDMIEVLGDTYELKDPSGVEAIIDRVDEYVATMLASRVRIASAHRNRRRARKRPAGLAELLSPQVAANGPVSLPGGIITLLRDELAEHVSKATYELHDAGHGPFDVEQSDRAARFDAKANVLHINLDWPHLHEQYVYWQRAYAAQPAYYAATIRSFVLDQLIERISAALAGAIGSALRSQRPFPTELAQLTTPEALTTAAHLSVTDYTELKKRLAQRLGAADPQALADSPY